MLNQKGAIHILPVLLIIAAVGIISFLLISSTAPSGGLFGILNPKPASHAASISSPLTLPPMPIISTGAPAFSSSGSGVSLANNSNYDDQWVSGSVPAWLAYNLSNVPSSKRGRVMVAWYPINLWADPTALPKDYTIEGNPAAGGSSAPTSGWVVLTTVTSNTEQWREHVVDMTGMNWIRINVSASSGGNVGFNFDVHDASQGTSDTWIFEGDGFITELWNTGSSSSNWPQEINILNSSYWPVGESYARDGDIAKSCSTTIKTWLANFPDVKFVGLQYGSVEAKNSYPAYTYIDYLKSCTDQIIASGRYPMVPHILFGTGGGIPTDGPLIDAAIDWVYSVDQDVLKGPDLWTILQAPGSLDTDGFHFSSSGGNLYHKGWVNAMASVVYNATSLPPLRQMPPALPANSVSQFYGPMTYTDTNNYNWTGLDFPSFTDVGQIAGTTDEALYRYVKNSPTLNFSLPNGQYNVILKFNEGQQTAAGQRVFNVNINGTKVLSNFDILSQVPPHTALDKTIPVNVTGGSVNISFGTVTGTPIISAVQVIPTSVILPSPTPVPSFTSTPTASPKPTPTPAPSSSPSPCSGADINHNGTVDLLDYSIVISNFGKSETPGTNGDINGNGTVDLLDYSTVISNFGKSGC